MKLGFHLRQGFNYREYCVQYGKLSKYFAKLKVADVEMVLILLPGAWRLMTRGTGPPAYPTFTQFKLGFYSLY
jgi:hypothetical protein